MCITVGLRLMIPQLTISREPADRLPQHTSISQNHMPYSVTNRQFSCPIPPALLPNSTIAYFPLNEISPTTCPTSTRLQRNSFQKLLGSPPSLPDFLLFSRNIDLHAPPEKKLNVSSNFSLICMKDTVFKSWYFWWCQPSPGAILSPPWLSPRLLSPTLLSWPPSQTCSSQPFPLQHSLHTLSCWRE